MSDLSLLSRSLGASERTLRRAADSGLLRAERVSERRVRLSAGEHRYLKHRWPLLSGLRGALRTEPNVRLAVLFGSVARGDENDASDVDVLVQLRDQGLFRVLELEGRLSRAVDRDVRLLGLDDARRDLTVLGEALKDARVLVDREDQWSELKRRTEEIQRLGEQELDERARRALARTRQMK